MFHYLAPMDRHALYEELMWSNDDELQFIIENGRIVILNKTHEMD